MNIPLIRPKPSFVPKMETEASKEMLIVLYGTVWCHILEDIIFISFKPGSSHVGFVVDKVAMAQVFSEYFGFPYQSLFHQFLHNHPHLSSGVGTIDQ
jgi:hypothetical protein